VVIVDPYGNTVTTFSGSKPEYGAGGFEIWAPHVGKYTVLFLDQVFEVQMDGRFTHLTFTEGEGPAAQGVISGVLRDHAGVPQAGQGIALSGIQVSRTATTTADGAFRFGGLSAGTFTLSVVGTDVRQTVQSDGSTPVTANLTLPPPTAGAWSMQVTRGAGLPLIVGSLPEAQIPIEVVGPSGQLQISALG
jgi:hypothetical protein